MRQRIARELRAEQQIASLVSRHGLGIAYGRLEQLLKLGLVLGGDERQSDIRNLACLRRDGRRGLLRRACRSERIGHLGRGHACRLGQLRLGGRSLLRRRCAGLEGLLLRSLLELLTLLPRIARELGLLLLREALRLAWEACELLLQLTSWEASRLRRKPALEAAGLLEGLLLAILGLLPRSGAVPTP